MGESTETHHQIEQECRKLYNDCLYNQQQEKKLRKRYTWFCILLAIIAIILIFVCIKIQNAGYLSLVLVLTSVILLISFLIYQNKIKKLRSTEQEKLLFALCSLANFISAFLKAEIPSDKDIKAAINVNKILQELFLDDGVSSNLLSDRGFKSDKKVIEFMKLLNQTSQTYFKETLKGKRNDEALRKLVVAIRQIVMYIKEEDFDAGINYIKSEFKEMSKIKEPSSIWKFLKTKQPLIWLVSLLIVIAVFVLILLVCVKLKLITTWQTPGWAIIAGAGVIFTSVIQVKTKIVDKFLENKNKL